MPSRSPHSLLTCSKLQPITLAPSEMIFGTAQKGYLCPRPTEPIQDAPQTLLEGLSLNAHLQQQ